MSSNIAGPYAGKYLKPYQGLKLGWADYTRACSSQHLRRKIPKTLSGIETSPLGMGQIAPTSRKIPKTLSGIETWLLPTQALSARKAGKYLKPYQGLKRKGYRWGQPLVPENT